MLYGCPGYMCPMPAWGLPPYICPGYMGMGMPGIAAPDRPVLGTASFPGAVGGDTLPMGPLVGACTGMDTGWAGASLSYTN